LLLRRTNLALVLVVIWTLVVSAGCLKGPQKTPRPQATPTKQGPVAVAKAGREPVLTLFDNKTGQKRDIKMEDYIAGVVAAEMEPSWPIEALAAQAMLARTFTLEALESKGGTQSLHGTDVSTKVEEFQAYDPSRINDNVRKAVQATRGKVLTYDGELIKAWFSAYAGPRTATAKEGLNFKEPEPPYIKSVSNPGIKNVPSKDKVWTVTFSRSELEAAISKMGFPPGNGSTVVVTKRGPSGRAMKINVFGTEVPGADFRVALGSTRLKSILIDDIQVQGDQATFQGRGFGHGVGMCQWGAYTMAKEGKKADDIVHYFFKGVKVDRLYS
jgi:stage II sporulation protein D